MKMSYNKNTDVTLIYQNTYKTMKKKLRIYILVHCVLHTRYLMYFKVGLTDLYYFSDFNFFLYIEWGHKLRKFHEKRFIVYLIMKEEGSKRIGKIIFSFLWGVGWRCFSPKVF